MAYSQTEGTKTMKAYKAILNGQDTTAKKIHGTWIVGGDKVGKGQSCLILLEKDGRPAWFDLRGAILKFSDFD